MLVFVVFVVLCLFRASVHIYSGWRNLLKLLSIGLWELTVAGFSSLVSIFH